jgi:glutamate racemase
MNKKIIGVIAGTKIDTRFGVDFLKSKFIKSIGSPISQTPQEQTALQALKREELTAIVFDNIIRLKKKGASSILIYCNSLSGAIDLEGIRKRVGINIVTPLEIYEDIALAHNIFGLIAANCQSAANIERTILRKNRNAIVIGVGNLNIVNDIERKVLPGEIIKKHRIKEICSIFNSLKTEQIILGCTHFPYFYEELKKKTDAALFEPSEEMVKLL